MRKPGVPQAPSFHSLFIPSSQNSCSSRSRNPTAGVNSWPLLPDQAHGDHRREAAGQEAKDCWCWSPIQPHGQPQPPVTILASGFGRVVLNMQMAQVLGSAFLGILVSMVAGTGRGWSWTCLLGVALGYRARDGTGQKELPTVHWGWGILYFPGSKACRPDQNHQALFHFLYCSPVSARYGTGAGME